MASIEIHDDVGKVESLDGVRNAIAVARCRGLAGCEVGVGDQVGQGVRLDDESKGGLGVRLQDLDNGINVLRLVAAQLADFELAVGSLGSAVTSGEIVDDQAENVVAGNISDSGRETLNVGNGVTALLQYQYQIA